MYNTYTYMFTQMERWNWKKIWIGPLDHWTVGLLFTFYVLPFAVRPGSAPSLVVPVIYLLQNSWVLNRKFCPSRVKEREVVSTSALCTGSRQFLT